MVIAGRARKIYAGLMALTGALLAIAITWFFFPRRAAELATYAEVAGK